MSKLKLAGLAILVAGTLNGFGQAPGLGLNFAATDPDAATSSLLAGETAGVLPQANWNNLTGASGTDVGGLFYDNNGAAVASSATVSWTSPNSWRSGGNNAFPLGSGDQKLLSGYLDTGNTAETGISITVENIDAAIASGGYDVYVYFVSDSGGNRGGAYIVDPGSGPVVKYGSSMSAPSEFVRDPGTDADLSEDGNYLRFIGLSGTSFTLVTDTTQTTPNGFRAPINAIQIVAAVPFGPDITTQPVGATVFTGGSVSFTASAEGFPAVTSLQWQKDGVDLVESERITGVNSGTLSITSVEAGDAGAYTFVATSSRGSGTSEPAVLEIAPEDGSAYETAIREAGPLAYWRLNEADTTMEIFDFAGGLTGDYDTGVLHGSAAFGPRPAEFPGFSDQNTSAMFDGFTGAANVATPELNSNTATFITWINPNLDQLDFTGIFMTRSGTTAGLGYGTGNQLGYTWNNNSTWSWESGLRPVPGQWAMVALVVEPEKATLYLGSAGALTAAINPIPHTSEAWGWRSADRE